jgi:hypothetical protein
MCFSKNPNYIDIFFNNSVVVSGRFRALPDGRSMFKNANLVSPDP